MRYSLIFFLLLSGALLVAGCQQRQESWNPEELFPQQQPRQETIQGHHQQPQQQRQPQQQPDQHSGQFGSSAEPESMKEQYLAQGQQQVAEIERAVRNLEQMVVQNQVESEYAQYRGDLEQGLQAAYEQLRIIENADDGEVDDIVRELILTIRGLRNTFQQAASEVHEHMPSQYPAY